MMHINKGPATYEIQLYFDVHILRATQFYIFRDILDILAEIEKNIKRKEPSFYQWNCKLFTDI